MSDMRSVGPCRPISGGFPKKVPSTYTPVDDPYPEKYRLRSVDGIRYHAAMPYFIVTVALPKDPTHDPKNKQTGQCPVNGGPCDDVTGEHHSFLTDGGQNGTVETIRRRYSVIYKRVTRVEEVPSSLLR